MPIGEDIPVLIPVALMMTVFVVFIIASVSGIHQGFDMARMSQVSLNIGNYISNHNLSCDEIKETSINPNYVLDIQINQQHCIENLIKTEAVSTRILFPEQDFINEVKVVAGK